MTPAPNGPLPWYEEDVRRLDYFQKHALPNLFEATKLRALGLQVFLGVQALLFDGWARSLHSALAVFGLSSCVAFYFWDNRTRQMMRMVHAIGMELADNKLFNSDERERLGVHFILDNMLVRSGKARDLRSLTVAIRVLLIVASCSWGIILYKHLEYWWTH